MIQPTIGRIVWFHPSTSDAALSGSAQPLAAIVAYVHGDRCVNLGIIDANGGHHSRCSVLLLQDEDAAPEDGYYAEWMPFQKGQAAKTEALEAKVLPATEQAIEAAIVAAGKTAPRLTPEDIDAAIVGEAYHVFPGTTVTICLLTLRNGFNVEGSSAAVSPSNFDEEIGRRIARTNARDKIWGFEGYVLKERLYLQSQSPIFPV